MGRINSGNEAIKVSHLYHDGYNNVLASVVREANRLRPVGLSDNTNTAAETIKNLSIYKINLSNRRNQQAMLGHMHELISRSLSGLVTKHDLRSGNETS